MNHCLFFERLGLLESFRRPWVCCKRSFYWGFELSHRMKSETHYPFVPMYYSLVLLKTLFLSLVPFTTVCCISPQKIAENGAPHDSCGETEPKTICFGLSKPSPIPSLFLALCFKHTDSSCFPFQKAVKYFCCSK